jgi:AcrR family transcriptional regulator
MVRRNTRQLILDVARDLFNERGIAAISTNHICEAAGISPGNLYYHFSNKQDIILELFHQMIAQWDEEPPPSEISLKSFYNQLEKMFSLIWLYRFLHREFAVLVREQEAFASSFQTIQRRRMQEMDKALDVYIAAGVFRPMQKEERVSARRMLWFFSLHWIPQLELEGHRITEARLREGIPLLQMIFDPFVIERRK